MEIAMVLPTDCSVGLNLVGICLAKSKVQLLPGAGVVVTNDLCIKWFVILVLLLAHLSRRFK